MLPLSDQNPQLERPYATYLLIAANIVSWILIQGLGNSPALQASICQYGLIPADLFLNNSTGNPCPTGGSWSGFFSSMFMHASWMHLLGNMWFLWVFGDNVEDAMGSWRYLCFYLLCGLLAAGAQVISQPLSAIPMVGASGAIGGVMGAYIMLYPRVRVKVLILVFITHVPAVVMLGYWFLVQSLGGLQSVGMNSGGVAFWAHVGGFLAGAALVWLFKDDEKLRSHPYHGWQVNQQAHQRNKQNTRTENDFQAR